MRKMLYKVVKIYKKNSTVITFLIGLLAVLFSVFPYLYLKKNIWVPIHDNLDGEVLNYIYNAKYLFSGSDKIGELMNGISKTGMITPAPMLVLFYKIFPPFYAYAASQFFVVFWGYVGMFLLLHEIVRKEDEIAFVVASIFCYLPFYNVYGLSILGQPLLVYAFWNLYHNKKKLWSYLCIILFASSSSLALVGFACIGLAMMFEVLLIAKKVWHSKRHFFYGICILGLTYLAFNLYLIKSMLGIGATETSHRSEFIIYGSDFWTQFKEIFFNGTSYTIACNKYIIYACFFLGILKTMQVIVRKRKKELVEYKEIYIAVGILFLLNVSIASFSAFLKTTFIANVRNNAGGIFREFQFDRVSWLLPTSWYILLALLLFLVIRDFRKVNILFRYLAAIILALTISWQVYNSSFIWNHLRLMIFPDTYHLTTWEDIYAEDIYSQIRDYIGKDQSSYRVVSLGIYPSSALYNGFYCLDGYSNNYSLKYKHQFRTIMKDELDRDSTIKQYFDEWGNRCYLMTKESGYYEMLEKTSNFVYKDLEINTAALKEMGGKYIFSAGKIENCDKLGIKLIRDKAFETEDSFYAIYVYEIL